MTNNLPVDVAKRKGADIVIAVDVSGSIKSIPIHSFIDVMLQSVTIMGKELLKYKRQAADILVEPQVGEISMMDFSQKKTCIEAGMKATEAVIPLIRAKIEEWKKR